MSTAARSVVSLVLVVSWGCATVREQVRNDDRPLRSFTTRDTSAVAITATVDATPDTEFRSVALAVHVSQHQQCIATVHNVVDRTEVTTREFDPKDVRGSLALSGYLYSTVPTGLGFLLTGTSKTSAIAWGSVATAGIVTTTVGLIVESVRVRSSSRHVGETTLTEKHQYTCNEKPMVAAPVQVLDGRGAVIVNGMTDAQGLLSVTVSREEMLRSTVPYAIHVDGKLVGPAATLAGLTDKISAVVAAEARREEERRRAEASAQTAALEVKTGRCSQDRFTGMQAAMGRIRMVYEHLGSDTFYKLLDSNTFVANPTGQSMELKINVPGEIHVVATGSGPVTVDVSDPNGYQHKSNQLEMMGLSTGIARMVGQPVSMLTFQAQRGKHLVTVRGSGCATLAVFYKVY